MEGGIESLGCHVGKLAAREPIAGCFQCSLKGTFFFPVSYYDVTMAKTDIKTRFFNECVKSSHSFSKSTFFFFWENSHASPGLAPGIHIICCVILGKSLAKSVALAVQ